MIVQRLITGALAAVILAATALPAASQSRVVTIVNNTGYTIVEFYGSNKGTDSWEEDILGYDVMDPYTSLNINFDDGTGYCIFDFKAVFNDGDIIVSNEINICEIPTFTYN